jgi:uncharacterized Zn-finger protein
VERHLSCVAFVLKDFHARATSQYTQRNTVENHLSYVAFTGGKGFSFKDNMTAHMNIHSGETPFMCSIYK